MNAPEPKPENEPEPKRDELDEFIDWASRDHLGCIFGRRLAGLLNRDSWTGAIFQQRDLPMLVDALDESVLSFANKGPELFQAILTQVSKPEEIIEFLRLLCGKERWYAYEVPWEPSSADPAAPDREPKAALVALRWKLPDDKHVSWSLGFGLYRELPWTRRGPYTSIILRVTPPRPEPGVAIPADKQAEFGLTPVHLAHMASGFSVPDALKQKLWDKAAEETGKLKRQKVEPDMLPAARGRVTFSFPLALRERLDFLVKYADVIKSKEAAFTAEVAAP